MWALPIAAGQLETGSQLTEFLAVGTSPVLNRMKLYASASVSAAASPAVLVTGDLAREGGWLQSHSHPCLPHLWFHLFSLESLIPDDLNSRQALLGGTLVNHPNTSQYALTLHRLLYGMNRLFTQWLWEGILRFCTTPITEYQYVSMWILISIGLD